MALSSSTQEKSDSGMPPQPTIGSDGTRRRGASRRTFGWVIAGLALAGLAAGIPYYLHAVAYISTDDAFIDGQIVSISPRVSGHVTRVCVTDNQKVAAGDLLVELDPRDFQARMDATLASLHAAEASNRSRGIDVNLTSTAAAAGLEEASAAVAAAAAMVENARALTAAAESRRSEAQAQVAFAQAELDQAKAETKAVEAKYHQATQDLKRYQEMARSNTVSPQQLDHAVTADRTAAAELDAARSNIATKRSKRQQADAALKAAEDDIHQAQSQVLARQAQQAQTAARLTSARSAPVQVAHSTSRAEESRADVEKARAEAEQATLNLSYTKIHSPVDGYVTRKNVDPGVYVQDGQSLMAIVSPQVWVTANFKETQVTHMRQNQPATVTVDTYPDVSFHGRVDSIQRGTGSRFSLLPPENATGNFVKVVQRIPVKIVFDRPDELARYLLVPGMSAVPEVHVKAEVPTPAPSAADVRSQAP